MRVGYLDCPSGISGDMLLGALVDAGWPEAAFRAALGRLPVRPDQVSVQTVVKRGIRAVHLRLVVERDTSVRRLRDLVALIRGAGLGPEDEARAIAIVERLGRVEAAIHDVPVDEVHFHELSGLDTVLDVVGAVAGLGALGVERLYVSPLNVGSGTIRTAHGILPVPAPATARLLEGFEVYTAGEPGERVTPTGAAIVAELATPARGVPRMRLEATGYGAGTKDFAEPNVARILLGEADASTEEASEELALLECNIDDMNPEYYGFIVERLLQDGALDAYMTPIVMKKGRPSIMLSVLCRPSHSANLLRLIFRESTTLGVRERRVTRHALARDVAMVQTPYGRVRVKGAHRPGVAPTGAPEYEDCRAAALAHGVPLRDVYDAALRAWEAEAARGGEPGGQR